MRALRELQASYSSPSFLPARLPHEPNRQQVNIVCKIYNHKHCKKKKGREERCAACSFAEEQQVSSLAW